MEPGRFSYIFLEAVEILAACHRLDGVLGPATAPTRRLNACSFTARQPPSL